MYFVIAIHLSEIYDFSEMTQQQIQEIQQAIAERGLTKQLKKILKIYRPTISPDTIERAWAVEDFESAPDALKLVLKCAKEIKAKDDERIRQALEAEAIAA